jgi:hypothetical protein
MYLEYYISGGALLVSIIFGIVTLLNTRKANRLQNEVLNLSKHADEFEIKKGEILLISLLGRYFVIQLNCWEPSGKMKSDKLSIQHFINELKQLNNDINNLITNPFYIEILEKYPEINLLWISLRYSIIDRENSGSMAVNPQTFEKFFDLYFKIKNEIKDKVIFENQFYVSTDEAADFLKKELPKLTSTVK